MIAAWGQREFYISTNELKSFADYGESLKVNISTEECEGRKDTTVLKGDALTEVSWKIKVSRIYGNDAGAEYDGWKGDLYGHEKRMLSIGGRMVSAYPFLLKELNLSNMQFDADGEILAFEADIKLQEVDEIISQKESERRKEAKEKAKKKKK